MKLLLTLCIATSAIGAEYKLDPVHSALVFKIGHAGIGEFYGQFTDLEGTLILGDKDPKKDSIELKIASKSVFTANKKRDDHLRSPDFFNAKEHQYLIFKSQSVKKLGPTSYQVEGTLKAAGKSAPLIITLTKTGEGQVRGKDKVGLATTFSFNRHDWGISYGKGNLSDDVTIMVGSEWEKI